MSAHDVRPEVRDVCVAWMWLRRDHEEAAKVPRVLREALDALADAYEQGRLGGAQ
jgi:hypothetical protein